MPLELAHAKAPIRTDLPIIVCTISVLSHFPTLSALCRGIWGGMITIFSVANEYTPMLALPKRTKVYIAT